MQFLSCLLLCLVLGYSLQHTADPRRRWMRWRRMGHNHHRKHHGKHHHHHGKHHHRHFGGGRYRLKNLERNQQNLVPESNLIGENVYLGTPQEENVTSELNLLNLILANETTFEDTNLEPRRKLRRRKIGHKHYRKHHHHKHLHHFRGARNNAKAHHRKRQKKVAVPENNVMGKNDYFGAIHHEVDSRKKLRWRNTGHKHHRKHHHRKHFKHVRRRRNDIKKHERKREMEVAVPENNVIGANDDSTQQDVDSRKKLRRRKPGHKHHRKYHHHKHFRVRRNDIKAHEPKRQLKVAVPDHNSCDKNDHLGVTHQEVYSRKKLRRRKPGHKHHRKYHHHHHFRVRRNDIKTHEPKRQLNVAVPENNSIDKNDHLRVTHQEVDSRKKLRRRKPGHKHHRKYHHRKHHHKHFRVRRNDIKAHEPRRQLNVAVPENNSIDKNYHLGVTHQEVDSINKLRPRRRKTGHKHHHKHHHHKHFRGRTNDIKEHKRKRQTNVTVPENSSIGENNYLAATHQEATHATSEMKVTTSNETADEVTKDSRIKLRRWKTGHKHYRKHHHHKHSKRSRNHIKKHAQKRSINVGVPENNIIAKNYKFRTTQKVSVTSELNATPSSFEITSVSSSTFENSSLEGHTNLGHLVSSYTTAATNVLGNSSLESYTTNSDQYISSYTNPLTNALGNSSLEENYSTPEELVTSFATSYSTEGVSLAPLISRLIKDVDILLRQAAQHRVRQEHVWKYPKHLKSGNGNNSNYSYYSDDDYPEDYEEYDSDDYYSDEDDEKKEEKSHKKNHKKSEKKSDVKSHKKSEKKSDVKSHKKNDKKSHKKSKVFFRNPQDKSGKGSKSDQRSYRTSQKKSDKQEDDSYEYYDDESGIDEDDESPNDDDDEDDTTPLIQGTGRDEKPGDDDDNDDDDDSESDQSKEATPDNGDDSDDGSAEGTTDDDEDESEDESGDYDSDDEDNYDDEGEFDDSNMQNDKVEEYGSDDDSDHSDCPEDESVYDDSSDEEISDEDSTEKEEDKEKDKGKDEKIDLKDIGNYFVYLNCVNCKVKSELEVKAKADEESATEKDKK